MGNSNSQKNKMTNKPGCNSLFSFILTVGLFWRGGGPLAYSQCNPVLVIFYQIAYWPFYSRVVTMHSHRHKFLPNSKYIQHKHYLKCMSSIKFNWKHFKILTKGKGHCFWLTRNSPYMVSYSSQHRVAYYWPFLHKQHWSNMPQVMTTNCITLCCIW